jgi:hypothetical protein
MGYRSDGKIFFYALDEQNFPLVKLWVDENFPKEDFEREEFKDGVCFAFYGWEWYSDYEIVERTEAAFKLFDSVFNAEEAPLCAYELVRVGEEAQDIEYYVSLHAEGRLQVNREIVVT